MIELNFGEWLLYVENNYGYHAGFLDYIKTLKKELTADGFLDEDNKLKISNQVELYKFYLNYLDRFHYGIVTFITGKLATIN